MPTVTSAKDVATKRMLSKRMYGWQSCPAIKFCTWCRGTATLQLYIEHKQLLYRPQNLRVTQDWYRRLKASVYTEGVDGVVLQMGEVTDLQLPLRQYGLHKPCHMVPQTLSIMSRRGYHEPATPSSVGAGLRKPVQLCQSEH